MKKKFLTGMLLGTLALSATPFVVGCSDDDDISRLEEQVAANTNAATVDKNELLALINKTSAELTEQLELAVSGKADNQAVIELQKKSQPSPSNSTRHRVPLPSRLLRSFPKSTLW